MAASINDKFTEATNGSRPVPTTLTALLPSGASPGTATCGALTGWATATAVHFVIYTVDVNGRKVSGSQTDWKGVVSGSTITGLVLKAETNNGYAIGAVVEAAPTAAWADDLVEGIAVEHKQDGTHKAITADSIVTTGAGSFAGGVTDSGVPLATTKSDMIPNSVVSGGVIAQTAGLTASFSDLTYYYAGVRLTKTSVSNRAYTASKDTYVDINNAGTITYIEVANGATSGFALTANSIRLAKVVTSGAAITSVQQYGIDGMWVLVYPTNFNPINTTHVRAQVTTGYSNPANGSLITLDLKIYDTLGEFNTTTKTFTATRPGLYQLIGRFWWGSAGAGSTEGAEAHIFVNGGVALQSDRQNGSNDANGLIRPLAMGSVYLKAGDTVDLRFVGTSGVRDISNGTYTFLEIHRIG